MKLLQTLVIGASLGIMASGTSALARNIYNSIYSFPTYEAVPGGYLGHDGRTFLATPDARGQCPSTGRCTRIDMSNTVCAYYNRPNQMMPWIGRLLMPSHCYL